MKRLLLCVFCFSLAAQSAVAEGLPDLGGVGYDTLTPTEERALGAQIMREVRKDPAVIDDPVVEEYIDSLGQRLAKASTGDGKFEFFTLRDRSLNAFALPGGYIAVHSALIITTESESELAGVIGHEIGHVQQRHIAQLMGKQKQLQGLLLAALAAAVASNSSRGAEVAIATSSAAIMQKQLAYSREFERESDRIGLATLEKAGLDPRGMGAFFKRLQSNMRLYENNAPAYMRTHPMTVERISDMENRVMKTRYKQVPDSDDYRYVRARLKAQSIPAREAVKFFETLVAKTPDDIGAYYGLTYAQLRQGDLASAASSFEALKKRAKFSPIVATLGADLASAHNDRAGAIAQLEEASRQFPTSRVVIFALAEAQITGGQAKQAEAGLRRSLMNHREDARLWELLAKANATLKRHTAEHRALAEAHATRGSYVAALQQLELARRANDGDFYDMSTVDSRLREVRPKAEEELKQKKLR